MEDRVWQREAFAKFDKFNSGMSKNIVPVNACVGSGKTNVAAYAIGDFIKKNLQGKTLQVFVTPRIKLCKQQADSLAGFIDSRFGLVCDKDYDILRYDCSITSSKLDLRSSTFASRHAVIVICDESLWGVSKDYADPDCRWHAWMSFFKRLAESGYSFGNIVFDEAHNFTYKHAKIFGETFPDSI